MVWRVTGGGLKGSLHAGNIFDANPFTRSGLAFLDPAEELDYQTSELGPLLRVRILRVAALLAAITATGFVGELALAFERMSVLAWLPLLPVVSWLLLAASLLVRPKLSSAASERCCFVALCVHGAIAPSPRVALFFGSAEVQPLVQCFGMLLASIFLPTSPVVTAGSALAALAGTAAWRAAGGDRTGQKGMTRDAVIATELVLTLAGIVGVGIFTRWYMYVAHRRFFHWARTVRIEHKRTLAARVSAEQLNAEGMRHAHAQRLEAATTAAREARSRLIRVFMHDIRSPLLVASTAAVTLAEVMGEATRDSPTSPRAGAASALLADEARESVQALCVSCARLEKIVADMIDFEKVEALDIELEHSEFSLGELGSAVWHACAQAVAAAAVGLRIGPVDADVARLVVVGDLARLAQCVEQGVLNAVKASPVGELVSVSIQLGSDMDHALLAAVKEGRTSGWAVVRVVITDRGKGLERDALAALNSGKVFERLGEGQLGGDGGTGLGLARTRAILALHHDSRLLLRSEGMGRGTAVELSLNLRRADGHGGTQPAPLSSPHGPERGAAHDARELGESARGALLPLPSEDSSADSTAPAPSPVEGGRRRYDGAGGCWAERPGGGSTGSLARFACANGRSFSGSPGDSQRRGTHDAERSGSPAMIWSTEMTRMPRARGSWSGQSGRRTTSSAISPVSGRLHGSARVAPHASFSADYGATGQLPAAECRPAPIAAVGVHVVPEAAKAHADEEPLTPALSAAQAADVARELVGQPLDAPTLALAVYTSGVGEKGLREGEAACTLGGGQRESAPAGGAAARPARVRVPALSFPAGFRVLYAEDDAVLRRSIVLRAFKPLGAPVDEASDGRSALHTFEASPLAHYALMLLDNQMPNMTGAALAIELRRRGYVGKVIGMTGDPKGSSDRDTFERSGVDLVLDKDSSSVRRFKEILASYAAQPEDALVHAAHGAALSSACGHDVRAEGARAGGDVSGCAERPAREQRGDADDRCEPRLPADDHEVS